MSPGHRCQHRNSIQATPGARSIFEVKLRGSPRVGVTSGPWNGVPRRGLRVIWQDAAQYPATVATSIIQTRERRSETSLGSEQAIVRRLQSARKRFSTSTS